jgi:hypothetical protein
MTYAALIKILATLVRSKGLEYHVAERDGNLVTIRFYIEGK